MKMNDYQALAHEVDKAIDRDCVQVIENALSRIDSLLNGTQKDDPTLLFFRANFFAALRKINYGDEPNIFEWQQSELSQEIMCLRRAVRSCNFSELEKIRRCQILTNLGNALNAVGRTIEAVAAWDAALCIVPKFAMAAANRAFGLLQYSAALYDPGHQCIFLMNAAEGFRAAISDEAVLESDYPDMMREQFREKLEEIERYIDARCTLDSFDPYAFGLGQSDDDVQLNKWRLENRLFLNPLNDLATWPIAAQDIFHLPSHIIGFDEQPAYAQYFDLIKEEYVAACVLLHEGLGDHETHPADKTLLTFEHADYSVTSIQIEKRKMAFRMAYSLLDKCAVFVNAYFGLGHNPRSNNASFKNIWFKDIKTRALHEKIPQKNSRLRGLYAISLDLFDTEFKEISSPLAVKADEIRNAAEHRFVTIHEFSKPDAPDPYLERVTEGELEELAIHSLKLARATIMGMSLAVHHQENHLREQPEKGVVMPITPTPKKRD